ncbi:J domain-containing protein [Catalinimonas niigatensis]|uniref:J domain-containing protein n=1 Tax=Catalinimonas niigatensis TaxID=1397264 RepID=UPI0026652761|nr:J domain-containing protein [Catalinimonas niigatensis]WPP48821.1 J domain-containing protein [Catalinimonas niigatensis]
MKKNTLPVIGKKDQQQVISKRQKEFNRRIKKVNALKAELEDMEKSIPEIRSYYQQQIVPVQDKIAASRVRFVKLLDTAYDMKYFRGKEKEKIREILLNHAYELITHYGKSELEPIYDKHSEISYQEEKASVKDMSRDMAEDMFKDLFDIDVDLEGVDLDNFEEIGDRFQQQAKAREEQKAQQKQKRKKTKAQQAREERQAKEAKSISKTTREIYMKLVREFHPDRETDEQKQAEMTEKMQRITEAYKKDDFYELLRLEMELLQGIDERLDELSDEQLKLYNKLLKEQEDELSDKLHSLEFMPSMDMPAIEPFVEYLRFKKYAPHAINRDHHALKEKLRMMKNDIKILGDKQNLRDFLHDYEIEREDEMEFFFPFDDFEDED